MQLIAQGVGAATGIATGCIRVLHRPEDLAQLEDGEVLVIQRSHPAWTIGMQRAGAVICEYGSISSHTAVVAREMGVPCVVAVANATSICITGMLVCVNGELGTIHAL